MLVLTRKANEQIQIGDDIKITLVRIRGNTVRIGIEAPRDIRVVRGELEEREKQFDDSLRASDLAERESVFAHPQGPIGRHRGSFNRATLTELSVTTGTEQPDESPVAGSVRPASNRRDSGPAPLSGVVSAT